MRDGFSLLEVVVATAILAMLCLAALGALDTSTDAYQNGATHVWLDVRLRNALDRVARDLRNTAPSQVAVAAPADVSFAVNLGYDGNAIVWGTPTRYFQDTAAGTLVRQDVVTGAQAVVMTDVPAGGFVVVQPPGSDTIEVTLTAQLTDPDGEIVSRTLSISVELRSD